MAIRPWKIAEISLKARYCMRSLLVVLGASTAAAVFLLILSQRLIDWWVGPRIHPSFPLLLGIAVWTILNSCGDVLGVFLNGASIIRFQVIVASVFGIGCLVTKVLLIRQFGIVGIPWATVIAYLLLNAAPYFWYLPVLIKRLNDNARTARSDAVIPGGAQ